MRLDYRSIAGHLASLAWVAFRSFVGTTFVVMLAGVLLACLSCFCLREYHWVYGVIAVVVALIESAIAAVVLGSKRAMVMALAHGLGKLRLGEWFVHQVFERMLKITKSEDHGERGGRMVQGLKRLPLARADGLLSGAVRSLAGDAAQSGWLRRKIQGQLLNAVQKYTLVRFREEGAKHGGVDLLMVKAELELSVDDALVQKVRSGLRLWMTLVILGLPLVVALQTGVMILLLRSKS